MRTSRLGRRAPVLACGLVLAALGPGCKNGTPAAEATVRLPPAACAGVPRSPEATASQGPGASMRRAVVDLAQGSATGPARRIRAGEDLQAAIRDAKPGDTLLLEAGATFIGPFVLPRKDGDGWITIRGARGADTSGGRVRPSGAGHLPKLVAPQGHVIATAPGAHHYRLADLEIRPTVGQFLHNLVVLGDAKMPDADVPHHIVIERCWLHGDPAMGGRRGVALNSAHTAIVRSYLSDFKEAGADSQAVAGWAGPGPFLLEDDYFEAAGENVMFGGADPPNAGRIPSDIEIRRCHFAKALSWKRDEPEYDQSRWSVKNLFELKDARRVLVEGNVFEHNWPHAQNGFAILFTVRNQDGTAPFSVVEDVEFRGNVVRRTGSAMSILGRDDSRGGASERTKRVRVRDNLFAEVGGPRWGGAGTLLQVVEGPADVVFEHNTAFHVGNVVTADGAPAEGFVFRDNIAPHNEYGLFGSGAGVGTRAIAQYFPGSEIRGNVMPGGKAEAYPAGNLFPDTLAEVVALDPATGVARLPDQSPYRGTATDGRDPGADPDAVCAALLAVSE